MPKSKAKQALEMARSAAKSAGTWIDLHNALFGMGGRMIELFPTEADRAEFSRTDEFKAIMALIDESRDTHGDPAPIADRVSQANGNVSVRMPRSIHAALLAEAEAEGVSLNQLCLAKLSVQLRAILAS